MSSRFKFRAWDVSNNEMYQVGTLTFEKSTGKLAEILDPVMQYTGLKDKNGVEIYEGDILSEDNSVINWDEKYGSWKAEYKDVFGHHWPDLWICAKRHEVVGNIHENPELLNTGTKGERNEKCTKSIQENYR